MNGHHFTFAAFLRRLSALGSSGQEARDAAMAERLHAMSQLNPKGFRQFPTRAQPGEGKRFAKRAAIRRETCAVIRAEQATRRRTRGAGLTEMAGDLRDAQAALTAARERLNMARVGRCPDSGEALS